MIAKTITKYYKFENQARHWWGPRLLRIKSRAEVSGKRNSREQKEDKVGKIMNYNIHDITVSAKINSFVVMTLPFRISCAWNFCSTFNP